MAAPSSSHGSIRIDPCRDADVPALQVFIDEHWRKGHILARDLQQLRWQFDPALMCSVEFPGPSVLLAWDGDDIVGMLGLTGFALNARGSRVPAVWMSHWVAIPAVRRQGVAMRLFKEVSKLGYGAIGTVGVTALAAKVLRTIGFETVDLCRWVGVFDTESTAELLRAASDGTVTLADARAASEGFAVGDVDAPSAEVEALAWTDAGESWNDDWRSTFAPRLVSTERDADYLRRRYVDHPWFDYQLTLARGRSSGRIEGLLVYRIERPRRRDEKIIRIVEFLAETDAAAGVLASTMIHDALREGAAFADFYSTSGQRVAGLEACGFRKESKPTFPTRFQPLEAPGFVMSAAMLLPQDLRGSMSRLAIDGMLYLTKSDADQDRPN